MGLANKIDKQNAPIIQQLPGSRTTILLMFRIRLLSISGGNLGCKMADEIYTNVDDGVDVCHYFNKVLFSSKFFLVFK